MRFGVVEILALLAALLAMFTRGFAEAILLGIAVLSIGYLRQIRDLQALGLELKRLEQTQSAKLLEEMQALRKATEYTP